MLRNDVLLQHCLPGGSIITRWRAPGRLRQATRLMRSDRLRFEVGQRVQCRMGRGRWESGRVIQLFYEADEEDGSCFAAAGRLTFPYQARLDRGSYHGQPRNISATADADRCIRLPDGIVDDGNAGYDTFEEESLDVSRLEFSSQPDCPVCAVPLPLDGCGKTHSVFMQCCGKSVCLGCNLECSLAARKRGIQRELWDSCAFCRSPPSMQGRTASA